MAISNELSSDVAAAILANKTSPQELNKLKDIILEVHSVLQKMSKETRADRLNHLGHKEPQEGAKSTGTF
jgi:hypothetical protein